MEELDKKNQSYDVHPDPIVVKTSAEAMGKPIIPGFQNLGSGISPVVALESLNFTSNSSGWRFGSNGDAQINGTHPVTTHFTPVVKFKGLTLYISDGTSPNGTLSGATGDICLHGDSGKIYFCVGSTTWTAPS